MKLNAFYFLAELLSDGLVFHYKLTKYLDEIECILFLGRTSLIIILLLRLFIEIEQVVLLCMVIIAILFGNIVIVVNNIDNLFLIIIIYQFEQLFWIFDIS